MDPLWLKNARKYLNQKEVPGQGSNPWILGLWVTIPWIWSTVTRKDDTLLPWCGAFIRYVLTESGLTPPKKWYRASAYIDYGHRLYSPVLGAIAVLKTGKQHHVGIVAGKDHAGNIVLLGGNQGDAVKLSAFKPSLFVAYIWPGDDLTQIPVTGSLALISAAMGERVV